MMGTHLKSAREAAGLSQGQLAYRIGVTAQAISGWESGRSNPHTDRLAKIAKILGCGVNRLLTGEEEGCPPELLTIWNRLEPPELRAYALFLLGGMVGRGGELERNGVLPSAPVWESWD
jgi:transcriptional regulator with XRE-family HTH domain